MSDEMVRQLIEDMKKDFTPRYYDRQGKEMELLDWARKNEDDDYKIIKQDIFDRWFVSTVWIGLNMTMFGRGAPPLIFETMIFMNSETRSDRNDPLYLWQQRYYTEEQAIKGHEEAIQVCKDQLAIEERQRQAAESEKGSPQVDLDPST